MPVHDELHHAPLQSLACPLDGLPLEREGGSWRCASGHNFDIARQGYVHLLPVQKKRSKDPGDSKPMVAARQRFLGQGFYQPVAEAVSAAVLEGVDAGTRLACLDAGCGEGYYLRQLAEASAGRVALTVAGLDISKWAVQAAARADRSATWIVGSNANLPLLPESVDRVLCLFGFPVYPEFARVMKPGGRLIQVDAGPDHLRELREIIYPEVRDEPKSPGTEPDGFRLAGSRRLRFELTLDQAEPIADLLAMTPHLYRAKAEGREKAARLETISLTADVVLQVFERYAPVA